MKNFIFMFLIVATALSACKKDDETKRMTLDPTAMVYIKPAETTALKSANPEHLTPLEIVKRATTMRFYNDSLVTNGSCAGGFSGKDTLSATPAFLFYGTFIIGLDGWRKPYIVPDYIYMRDCAIEIFRSNTDIDTIAYIPNAVVKDAQVRIKAALEAQDTTAVYAIFNDAFKFIPITGPEYKELKRQGLN